MSHYELLYIITPQYTDEELKPIINKIKALIQKADGKITFEGDLGRKKLAYPIKHLHQGYYLLLEFDLETKKIKKLDTDLRLTNEILRHQIVSKKIKTMEELAKEEENKRKREKAKLEAEVNETQEIKPEIPKQKVSVEELDKKLDEILGADVI